jgi:hypothetical protein
MQQNDKISRPRHKYCNMYVNPTSFYET